MSRPERLDSRIHAALDADASPEDLQSLREDLEGTPAGRELQTLERALGQVAREPHPLPEGFERRVMAQIAVAPAPRLGLVAGAWARAEEWLAEALLPGVAARPARVAAVFTIAGVLIGIGGIAGYRAGLSAGAEEAQAAALGSNPAPRAGARDPSTVGGEAASGEGGGAAAGRERAPVVAQVAVEDPGERVLVRFSLQAPDARRVEVAGSFNGWGSKSVPLQSAGNGVWVAAVELPRGRYEYTFVIDGERWLPDPTAARLVDDGFGGSNALLEL